jgi:hypothetical protein
MPDDNAIASGQDKVCRLRIDDFVVGIGVYVTTTLIVIAAALFGADFVRPPDSQGPNRPVVVDLLTRFDGHHYRTIAARGYSYDPDRASDVAFFPLYPLMARCVASVLGSSADVGLILVAHASLAASFILFHSFARFCSGSERVGLAATLAFGVLPNGVFLRMSYSESLFVLLQLLFLRSVASASLGCAAVWAALASATRPVGVAFLPALVVAIVQTPASVAAKWRRFLVLTPTAVAGLLAYMTYQGIELGDPLAFAKTQTHWRAHPDVPWWEKLVALAFGEPVWNAYLSESVRYWRRLEIHGNALFSMVAINPLALCAFAGLITWGAWRRWLTGGQIVLSAALLVIPYITRGYDHSMLSTARFVLVVVPAYVVIGQIVVRLPPVLGLGLLCLGAAMLAAWTALFAAGYPFF